MDKDLITRRAASLGILLTVVSVSRAIQSNPGSSTSDANRIAPDNSDDLATRWGSDGTRELLSADLERFFGSETGDFLATGDNPAFRPEEMPRRHANGEYFISDQIRLPLRGVASHKIVLPSGNYLYHAFIHHNPYVRAFIETGIDNKIIAVALADLMTIKSDSKVVDAVPRITVFYRAALPPIDIQNEAINRMKDYYSLFVPENSPNGYDIHVFTRQLSN